MTAISDNLAPPPAAVADRPVTRRAWLTLGIGLPAVLPLSLFAGEFGANTTVAATMLVTAGALATWLAWLLWRQDRDGEPLAVVFRPLAPHYVQASVQICIYVYWGWYWRPVYEHAVLIVAQVALAYSLDMLLSLSRRRRWTVGFGPFPIILSTNLFLLFKPDWFYLQFAMVAVGIFGKEFVRWQRDGRSTHIFNPSALSLFVFSIALILTGATDRSFGEEIATTLNQPPQIYLLIFLLGLVVQGLFSVTLVTLMSALALIGLNFAYTGATGTYWFIDSNIPIAVFLGLHLLITDPATSPRTATGKAIFGLLYGAGVFLLYGLLGWFGAPTFYDKLLCVPILNLLVPLIDNAARRLRPSPAAGAGQSWSDISPSANRLHMAAWVVVFGFMFSTNFVGRGHPGGDTAFWESACDRQLHNGCVTLFQVQHNLCHDGDVAACMRAAGLAASNEAVADPLEQGQLLSFACDAGHAAACQQFRGWVADGGTDLLAGACAANDNASCFLGGLVSMLGIGTPVDAAVATSNWSKACADGWAIACGYLGEAWLIGKNVPPDPAAAAGYLREACDLGYNEGCATLGLMLIRGHGVPVDAERGRRLLEQACDRGSDAACANLR